jgi:hypothetical protein
LRTWQWQKDKLERWRVCTALNVRKLRLAQRYVKVNGKERKTKTKKKQVAREEERKIWSRRVLQFHHATKELQTSEKQMMATPRIRAGLNQSYELKVQILLAIRFAWI